MSLEQEYYTETVQLPARIRPEQFGVNAKFFNLHIRGKNLTVTHITGFYTYVEVAGEMFSIHQDDLLEDEHDAEIMKKARQRVREVHGSYKGY